MRSSKSRSRNKPNRNRPVGNTVNRVFDSSGPEGKVRGTPQQIIEKYNQLARDAQLSGDRVATENFQQHAEHYLRLLGEAQREQDQRRDEQERQNRDRQAERDRSERQPNREQDKNDATRSEADRGESDRVDDPAQAAQPDVLDAGNTAGSESGLVETPEAQDTPQPSAPPKRARKPRARKPAQPKGDQDQGSGDDGKDSASDSGPTKATG
ncbi:DUF4167 domain-containing protein [Roseovarius sp. D22-M7]|uniref:DUF4167 domain-containing protein n=1 Tax=Roseovarius sp. D22-M7 TaxID=3127116 RepID=UPI00300FBA48